MHNNVPLACYNINVVSERFFVRKNGRYKKLITTNDIRSKVYIIRGQVMLDKDLAEIYGYDIKRLNEQVKRNINRFHVSAK